MPRAFPYMGYRAPPEAVKRPSMDGCHGALLHHIGEKNMDNKSGRIEMVDYAEDLADSEFVLARRRKSD